MTETNTPAAGLPIEWDKLPLVLTPRDLAALLRVHTKTISVWKNSGELPRPVIDRGNVVRWHRDTIRTWLEACQR